MFIRIYLTFIIIYLFTHNLSCQIYSAMPHKSIRTAYNSRDSVYIFNIPDIGNTQPISIGVNPPDTLGGWTYGWFRYNPSTMIYDFLATGLSVDTITSQAGYMVIADRDTIQDTSKVWIVFNDFSISFINIDPGCEIIYINSSLESTGKFYYNPSSGLKINISVTYNYEWAKDKESGNLPSGRKLATVTDPPWEDTWYTLTVTDPYGLTKKDSIFYESKHSKAEMKIEYIRLDNTDYYPPEYAFHYGDKYYSGLGDTVHPAPAKYMFKNDSKNSSRCQWIIYQNKDSIVYDADSIVYEFYFPGEYVVKLNSWGIDELSNCVDSVSNREEPVKLQSSYFGETPASDSLVFPNVFTPNGDDFNAIFKNQSIGDSSNNIWRPFDVSIYDFSIVIFNRFGKKVHEYEGEFRNWNGWNGKVLDSDRDASEGVYFYVIDMVMGYKFNDITKKLDVKKFNKKSQSGFVHLFRELKN